MEEQDLFDVVIVGGGPAGLSAAIYLARAKYRVLVLEKRDVGGQIRITDSVVNYPGVEHTDGKTLALAMARQAKRFGAEFSGEEAKELHCNTAIKEVITKTRTYETLGILLACGANPRKLHFEGEEQFQGRGVAYCATCDGEFFMDRTVYVIGGGYAAAEEGLFLTRYAKKVVMIVREEDFTCARTIADRVKAHPKIEISFQTEIVSVSGEAYVTGAVFRDNQSGKIWESGREEEGIGIFVFAGYVPATEWLPSEIEKNQQGYLKTDRNQATSIPGVYGAGDLCVKSLRQTVTAVSDGAVAATSLELYVEKLHHELHIPALIQLAPDTEDKTALPRVENVFDTNLKTQVKELLNRMEKKVTMKVWAKQDEKQRELSAFLTELAALSENLSLEFAATNEMEEELWPAVRLFDEEGRDGGFGFHGVPTGEEFTSFLLAICRLGGRESGLPDEAARLLSETKETVKLNIFVSLTCTMCPETVRSAATLAMSDQGRGKLWVDVFDLSLFPKLKEQYQIRSVPCIVINDNHVMFGRKGTEELAKAVSAQLAS